MLVFIPEQREYKDRFLDYQYYHLVWKLKWTYIIHFYLLFFKWKVFFGLL